MRVAHGVASLLLGLSQLKRKQCVPIPSLRQVRLLEFRIRVLSFISRELRQVVKDSLPPRPSEQVGPATTY